MGEVPIVEEQGTFDERVWALVCGGMSNQDPRRVPKRFELVCLCSVDIADTGSHRRRSENTAPQQLEKQATLARLYCDDLIISKALILRALVHGRSFQNQVPK